MVSSSEKGLEENGGKVKNLALCPCTLVPDELSESALFSVQKPRGYSPRPPPPILLAFEDLVHFAASPPKMILHQDEAILAAYRSATGIAFNEAENVYLARIVRGKKIRSKKKLSS